MTEEHLTECLKRLDDARKLLDRIQTDLRGAQEFRDAVFDLLEGTPFCERADSTYDGLYGRLRAAVAPATARQTDATPLALPEQEWQPIETAPKDEVLWFWVRPKTSEEAYIDVDGESIFRAGPPRLFTGKYKTWSALETSEHWMRIPWPAPPSPTETK